MTQSEQFKAELEDLRETHTRINGHLGITPNHLLTRYYRLGKKLIERLEKLEKSQQVGEEYQEK